MGCAVPGRRIEVACGDVEEDPPRERVSVRPQTGRRKRKQHVACGDAIGPDDLIAFDDAHREAHEVELVCRHRTGMLRHLPADERTAGLTATLGDTCHQRFGLRGIEPTNRDVVEEPERLRALARDVVDAHRDEIDTNGVEPTGLGRDHHLRPDAIGGRHQDRLLVAARVEREETTESADATDDLGAVVDCTCDRMR